MHLVIPAVRDPYWDSLWRPKSSPQSVLAPCILGVSKAPDSISLNTVLYRLKEKKEKSLSHFRLFCDPMDCSLPGSSIHGIFQAGVLEWVAISFSRGSSQPRAGTWVSCIEGRCFTIWATRDKLYIQTGWPIFKESPCIPSAFTSKAILCPAQLATKVKALYLTNSTEKLHSRYRSGNNLKLATTQSFTKADAGNFACYNV